MRLPCLSFNPSGEKIASASTDGKLIIWDLDSEFSQELDHEVKVNSVTFSQDGHWVATASDDEIVRIWDLDGGLVKTLGKHTDKVTSVLFSPDGKYLASAGMDNKIYLWDLSSWKDVNKFDISGDSSELDALGFSEDGNMLSYGTDTVSVWLLNQEFRGGIWIKETVFNSLKGIPEGRMPANNHWLTVRGNKGMMVLSLGLDHAVKQACEWADDHLKTNLDTKPRSGAKAKSTTKTKSSAEVKGEHPLCEGFTNSDTQ